MPKYAISDIHGCPKTLLALLDRIGLSRADELFLLGDYVDRGPDSKGVLDLIFQLQHDGYRLGLLRGNHEEILLRAQVNLDGLDNWLATDGRKTLDSFGLDDIRLIPQPYLDLMDGMHYFLEVDEYILVHAGLNFHLPDPFSNKKDLTTLRHWHEDIRYDWLGNRIILHGHTPMMKAAIDMLLLDLPGRRYLDIDAGCAYAGHDRFAGFGYLCAFDMTNRKLIFQENVE